MISFQICIRLCQGAAITSRAVPRIAMPQVSTPLQQLPVHLRQPPAVHKTKEAHRHRSLAVITSAARAVGVTAVVIRPAGIERVAEMEGCTRPGPAGRLPLALARQGQLGGLALVAEFRPLLLQPEVQPPHPFLAVVPAHAVHRQAAGFCVALPQPLGFVGAAGRADVTRQ